MKYFVDTEFEWRPVRGELCPISIALVAEDGREYYAYCANFRNSQSSPFVESNVMTVIQAVGPHVDHKPLARVGEDILRFIGDDKNVEFWGDCAAFDYVMLSMAIGGFEDWPDDWPYYIRDINQENIDGLASKVPHNALADARAVRDSWKTAMAALVN